MIELVEATDSRAVRNKNNVLALYDLMINQKRSEEATAKFVSPSYIQHNPLIPDGSSLNRLRKAIEHWDTLQLVCTPQNSAPMVAPNIPRANANGMF